MLVFWLKGIHHRVRTKRFSQAEITAYWENLVNKYKRMMDEGVQLFGDSHDFSGEHAVAGVPQRDVNVGGGEPAGVPQGDANVEGGEPAGVSQGDANVEGRATPGVPQGGDNVGGVPILGNILLKVVGLFFLSKWVN